MANDLLKNITKTFHPYLPAVDATPYIPARSAWTEKVTTKVCTTTTKPAIVEYKKKLVGSGVIRNDDGSESKWEVYELVPVVVVPAREIKTCENVTTFVEHPATPAVEAQPGHAARFAYTELDLHMGWTGSAQSVKSIAWAADGYGEFNMPLVTGVIVGLSSSPDSALVDYKTIDHALYFGNGTFKIMERGAEITAEFSFAAGDKFRIARSAGAVQYLQNDAVVFSSDRPSVGAVRMDAAVYSGNDSINNPKLVEGAIGPALVPVFEGGFDSRQPLAGGHDGTQVAWGSAQQSLAAGGHIESELVKPSYSAGIGMVYAPLAGGDVLSGGLISGVAVVAAQAQGYTYAYAAGGAMANPPLAGGVIEQSFPDAIDLPPLVASGSGRAGQVVASELLLPSFSAEGFGAAVVEVELPALVVEGAGTVAMLGGFEIELPDFEVEAAGTVGAVGELDVALGPFTVEAWGAVYADVSLPAFVVEARADIGVGASGDVELPAFSVEASGIVGIVGFFDITLPGFESSPYGDMDITLPLFQVFATGMVGDQVEALEAYSTNLRSDIEGGGNEMTRFTEFPFLRVLYFNGDYYGLAADGLHRIEGERDGDAPIKWEVSTGTTDFGARELKHIPSCYVGGRFGPAAKFVVHEGERRDFSYCYMTPRGQTAQNYRQHFGKGLRARYFSFTLSGENEFELDGLHFEVAASKRRI